MAGSGAEDTMADWYKFLMLIGIALGLALYLQVLRNRSYWVAMETLIGIASLLCLPFASSMIDKYQTTGTNSLAVYLFRLMLFARVSQAAVIFLTRNSNDPTVAIGISITNILSRTALLMCAFHGIYHTKTISKEMLRMDVIHISLLIIGDIFQLTKVTTRDGSLTIGDPVSFHLSIDGLVKFVMASWIFGFPEMFLTVVNPNIKPNEGQLALAQVIGSMVFGLAVLSFACLCFKHREDAVTVLKAKLVFYIPAILFGFVMVVTDAQYRLLGHMGVVMGGMSLLGLNAMYAVWQDEKEKYE